MIPSVGTTCKYFFTAKFIALEGVYTLLSVASFETRLTQSVDFVSSLYTPAGLSRTDFSNDAASFKGCNVLQLQSVKDKSVVLYVPQPILSTTPDPTVKRFKDLVCYAVLGPHNDQSKYEWAKDEILDTLQNVLGVDVTIAWGANPDNDTWLTNSEYAAQEAERAQKRKRIVTKSEQITALQATVDSQAEEIRALKAILFLRETTTT